MQNSAIWYWALLYLVESRFVWKIPLLSCNLRVSRHGCVSFPGQRKWLCPFLVMSVPCQRWTWGIFPLNPPPSEPTSAPAMFLHAPTIIMGPLATPERSSSACKHWSSTRFSPKWIGCNASFKHDIWANARSSLQREALTVSRGAHGVNTQAHLRAKGGTLKMLRDNAVQTTINSFRICRIMNRDTLTEGHRSGLNPRNV